MRVDSVSILYPDRFKNWSNVGTSRLVMYKSGVARDALQLGYRTKQFLQPKSRFPEKTERVWNGDKEGGEMRRTYLRKGPEVGMRSKVSTI